MTRALTRGGRLSARAVGATLIAETDPPPLPPGSVQAVNVSTTTAQLTWTAGSDPGGGVAGYRVYSVVAGVPTQVAEVTSLSHDLTGLSEGTSYLYWVKTLDNIGQLSAEAAVAFVTGSSDVESPTQPGNLAASNVTETSMRLTWNPSTDNVAVTAYKVYLEVFGDFLVATVTGTLYDATGLTSGSSHTWRVSAVDAAGNESTKAQVTQSTLTPSDTTPPSQPGALVFSATTQTGTTVSWAASTDNVGVTGYRVYEVVSGVDTLRHSPTTLSQALTALTPSTTYTIKVSAVDAAGNESTKRSGTVTTLDPVDTTPPSDVTGLAASAISQNQFTLTWNAASDPESGIAHYTILQVVAGAPDISHGTTTSTSVTLTGLEPDTLYPMRVRAVNGAGLSSATPAALGVKTTAGSSAGPYDRAFGIAQNAGSNDQVTGASNAIANDNHLKLWRKGIDMSAVPESGSTFVPTTGQKAIFQNHVTNGQRGHLGLNYCKAAHQNLIQLGQGTAVAGNTYITLNNLPPEGGQADSRGGVWQEISIHGPGIPESNPIVVAKKGGAWSGKQLSLQAGVGGGAYTLTTAKGTGWSGGTASGSYWMGGTGIELDQKITPECPASQTGSLAPYGRYCRDMVAAMKSWIDSIELSNEQNFNLGCRPFVDVALQYRNLCHGYVGAKLGWANVIVVAPGTGGHGPTILNPGPGQDRNPDRGFYHPVNWYQAIKTEKTTNQPNYFSTLANNLGVTVPAHGYPFDCLAIHPYAQTITGNPSTNVVQDAAIVSNIYNNQLPVMFTENGPNWLAAGEGGSTTSYPLTAAAAGTWFQAALDVSHGNVRWPYDTAFGGADGAILSASSGVTLTERRAAARRLMRPWIFFSLVPPPGGQAAGEPHGLYRTIEDGAAVSNQKWSLSDATIDPVNVMRSYS